ncbi:MAG: hypothetical protein V7646_4664, partial [Pseudonocardia sp.]
MPTKIVRRLASVDLGAGGGN